MTERHVLWSSPNPNNEFLCDKCAKSDVCKYKEEYFDMRKRLKISEEVKEPFEIIVKCRFFAQEQGNFRLTGGSVTSTKARQDGTLLFSFPKRD